MSHVAWSVCLSVCWLHGCAVQKRLNWSRCRLDGWLAWAQRTCIRWGRDPDRTGKFWGWSGPLKSIGNLCGGVFNKGDRSILNNGMTARLLQPTTMLLTGRCYITLSSVKNSPSAMRPFVKIVWPLISFRTALNAVRCAKAIKTCLSSNMPLRRRWRLTRRSLARYAELLCCPFSSVRSDLALLNLVRVAMLAVTLSARVCCDP